MQIRDKIKMIKSLTLFLRSMIKKNIAFPMSPLILICKTEIFFKKRIKTKITKFRRV